MKMDTRGVIRPESRSGIDINGHPLGIAATSPRFSYRVAIVGGGMAGLGCAEELRRIAQRFEKMFDLEIVILEARDRLGGRIFTDRVTFRDKEGCVVPIDLGASWIHGKDLNPLAAKARERNLTLIATSENVALFDEPRTIVDADLDHKIEQTFNALLDDAVSNGMKSRSFTDSYFNGSFHFPYRRNMFGSRMSSI
jgi:monoamine oxidase